MTIENVEGALEIIENHRMGLDELAKLHHSIGKDRLDLLDRKIKTFISRIFPDYERRQKDYYNTVHAFGFAVVREYTDAEKQEEYQDQIRKTILFVDDLIGELKVYGLEFDKKIGPKKTETVKEVSGGIPGLIRGKWSKTKEES
ncbi:MAG: hypothetical protein HYU56_01255 [Candidatus Aenigmarchaeota archaeon]|nr:hypothetical protein [Candidatus Aenigmarchaeota archaeon]